MSSQTNQDLRRIARVRLDAYQLALLLNLPPGLAISHVYQTQDPVSFNVIVAGPTLEPVPHDVEAPVLRGSLTKMVKVDDLGRSWHRHEWDVHVELLP